jgi:hypothetical protein
MAPQARGQRIMTRAAPTATEPNADRDLEFVVERITQQLGARSAEPQQRRSIQSQFANSASVPVREFVSVFVERRVRGELRAAAKQVAPRRIGA